MKNLDEQTAAIIGISYEVMNDVGCGFREKAYERGMIREFQLQTIPYDQQRQFPLFYKDTQIDILIPDLIVFDQIIVDTKTIKTITERELAQMLSYLKATKLPLGLIINFGNPKVEIERVHPLR
ncbi:GxxExxY protein [Luteolibacter flavescens]|uniref:GxxExxY protein n=1 Tax=Luteolibacter flavescens TaxID=1859460 RepID=A0ABT3FSE9_9BACT|nr:GxxExxY protein [Luteolibacter flavescens]MCW1886513.1 GxxExxY protein [Luteolibacter flavescens]